MYLKLIICFALLGTLASNPLLNWSKYKQDFNKVYESAAEEIERLQIFRENVNRMLDFQRNNPDATFQVGINHLTDRRIEELVSSSKHSIESFPGNTKRSLTTIDFPDSFDWRTKGVISPVEDQGALGQASAFTAVEIIETLYAIKTGKLDHGSVARVIDCCPQPVDPFQCIKKLGGICSAGEYPTPLGHCTPDQCKPVMSFDKAVRLQGQNENEMVAWIQNSTLYVGIDASRPSFQMYTGGLYNEPSCSKTMVDHTMQLVGYGKTESGEIYWICKNTWGMGWGEQGYMRVLRGQNVCGIASYVIQVS